MKHYATKDELTEEPETTEIPAEAPATTEAPPVTPVPTVTEAPTGEPTETSYVQWPVQVTDIDIALTTSPWTAVVGSIMQIDDEVMTVSDVTIPDNIGVTRTDPVPHDPGTLVKIWGTIPTLVGKTVASVSSYSHGSVLVIDILGTDDKHYLMKVSHQQLEIGGTVYWDTGILV